MIFWCKNIHLMFSWLWLHRRVQKTI